MREISLRVWIIVFFFDIDAVMGDIYNSIKTTVNEQNTHFLSVLSSMDDSYEFNWTHTTRIWSMEDNYLFFVFISDHFTWRPENLVIKKDLMTFEKKRFYSELLIHRNIFLFIYIMWKENTRWLIPIFCIK